MDSGVKPGRVVIAYIAVTLLLIANLTPIMYPIHRGSVDEFWYISTGVALTPHEEIGGIAEIDGNWAYYTPFTMDSSWTYRIPRNEVMRDFPRVLKLLEARAAGTSAGSLDDPSAEGYRRWKALPASQQDAPHLTICVEDARADLAQERVGARTPVFDDVHLVLRQHVARARWYWANVAGESLLFAGLIWFILWPFVYHRAAWRKALHLFMTPVLLLLPLWCGYNGVTPNIELSGGVLYPYVLMVPRTLNHIGLMPGPTNWEHSLISGFPQVLAPLNQCPAWDFDELLRTDAYFPGPVNALSAGLCAAGLFAIITLANRFRTLKRARGFEVLSTAAPDSSSLPVTHRTESRL